MMMCTGLCVRMNADRTCRISEHHTRAELIAAARVMPEVCAVLVSSWLPLITRTPFRRQSTGFDAGNACCSSCPWLMVSIPRTPLWWVLRTEESRNTGDHSCGGSQPAFKMFMSAPTPQAECHPVSTRTEASVSRSAQMLPQRRHPTKPRSGA